MKPFSGIHFTRDITVRMIADALMVNAALWRSDFCATCG